MPDITVDKNRNNKNGRLTRREQEILKLIAEGKTNRTVARTLGISVRTIEHHRFSIIKKLKLTNTVNLVKYAVKNSIIVLM